MKEEYKVFKDSIKKKHSIRNTPQYEENIDVEMKKSLYMPMSKKVIEILGWELLHEDVDTIYVANKSDLNFEKERIYIRYVDHFTKIVKSKSSGNEFWDFGRNSENVKLFIHILLEEVENLSRDEKERIQKEYNEWVNWDDYKVPDKLPKPNFKKPMEKLMYIGSISAIILLGFVASYLDLKLISIPVVTEGLVALVFWFILTRLSKISRFSDIDKIKDISILSLFLFFIIREISFYLLIKYPWLSFVGFFEFELIYYEPFYISFPSLEVIIFLTIYWGAVYMFAMTFWIALIRYISQVKLNSVPPEVVDFAFYLSSKNKTKKQIRYELSKFGWDTKENQDKVFESMEGLGQLQEFLKI